MGTIDLPKSPSSRKKPNAGRALNVSADEGSQQALPLMWEKETGIIMRYLAGKLPAEVFQRLDSEEGLSEKVRACISRHYREINNRYLASDTGNETLVFTAELLRSLGDTGQFNTGEIENPAKHTQTTDLESQTNDMLRHKTGMGVFFHGNSAGSLVKCVFRDNAAKPAAVSDIKLAINIPDSELTDPVFHRHAAARDVLADSISRHITHRLDQEINSGDEDNGGRVIQFLTGAVPSGFNPSELRENIESIRARGFNTAAVLLVSILGSAKMDYQFIENTPNKRDLVIREYEDDNTAVLPDERYRIWLRYFDRDMLAEACRAYDTSIKNFENDVQHLWDLIEVIYQDSKSVFRVNDFEDLAKKNKIRIRDMIRRRNGGIADESVRTIAEKSSTRVKLTRMNERIKNMYEFLYPIERRVMEERLAHLEKEYLRLDLLVNPRHVQPGLLIDVDMTSIKRRKTTLDSMTLALSEFLSQVGEGFHNAALELFPPASQGGGKKT